ncbi:MAG: hypothetical protein HND54_05430 [Bacteroidetes bacterium]|nr:hypothetical protein [Bacteroidota bacterium]
MKKIMALFLSLILLSSQVGFAVSVHFCGGFISESSISLAKANLSCGMESVGSSTCEATKHHDQFSKQSCCKDQSQVIQVNDNFNQKNNISNNQIDFIQLYTLIESGLLTLEKVSVADYQIPPPPLIKGNSQILFQIFRL